MAFPYTTNFCSFWNRIDFQLVVRCSWGLFLFFLSSQAYGQMDSLKRVAASLPIGEEKIDVWLDLSSDYLYLNKDSSIAYSDSIIIYGESLDYDGALGIAFYNKADVFFELNEYLKALDYITKAKDYFLKVETADNLANAYNLEGLIFENLYLLEKAAESYLKNIELASQANDLEMMELGYHNLGNLFIELGNYAKAEEYLLKALEINNDRGEYSCHSSIYSSLGLCKAATTNNNDELTFYKESLRYAQENDNEKDVVFALSDMGQYYYNIDDYPKAKQAYHNAILLEQKRTGLVADLPLAYNILAQISYKQGQVDSFLIYANLAQDVAKQNNDLVPLYDNYILFADYYSSIDQMDSAYVNMQRVSAIKDSIYQEDVQRQIQINADLFQVENKEKQIAEQKLALAQGKSRRNLLLIFGVLLLAIVAGVYQWYLARQNRRKQAAEFALAQQQQEAERLRELDQVKSNFFTNISHELRTPLSLILGPLTDVLQDVKSVPVKDKLHTIQRNGQKLLDMVNEIMDLSKVEAGKLELQPTQVDLIPFVKRVWGAFESLATIRRIKMHLDIAVEETFVLLDRDKVEKILNNLLSNAIKFTPADGFIRLRLSKKAGLYHFEVRDTGQGIHPDEQGQIFDRFFQAQIGNEKLQGGTGVGLALSKELAKLMKGDIQLRSALKEGSTFTFSLPLKEIDATSTMTQEQEGEEINMLPVFAPLSIQGQKPKILIVEDHPEMGKYLVQSLSIKYDCILATDGIQALHHLKIHQFDAITSDVMMPNMDGFELRAKINENPVWKHIPFLLLTARHLESDKLKGFQLGIDDYVTKPFSTLELQARIYNLIRNKIERDAFKAAEFNAVDQSPTENVDQKFLKNLEAHVLENLDNEAFTVEALSKLIGYSSKQLGRIVKKLTGLTTVNFILEIRLQKARTLLENRLVASVSEAQYEVGISSTSYFTRKFTERFGKNPRDLLQQFY